MMKIFKKEEHVNLALVVVLAVNLLLLLYVGFFKRDAYRLETLKVGGRENMQMAKELYRSDVYIQQQKSTLAQYLASLDTTDTSSDNSTATTPVAGDAEKLAAIVKDGYILGKKDAKITIIEYSDFLCPYCKRHYNAQTIENLIKKYPNDVNMVFRQMPLQQLHPTAPLGAQ